MDLAAIVLTFSLISGQLIKLPIGGFGGGPVLLDLVIVTLSIIGLIQIKLKLKQPPTLIKIALVFILIMIISLILSPLSLTPFEYLNSFFYIVRWSSFILLIWLSFRGVLKTTVNLIPKILITTGIMLSVIGLLQFIFLPDLYFLHDNGWDPHYFRTVSTFLDPNFLGAFLVLTLLFLVRPPKLISDKFNLALFITIYLAILTTFSRSSYGMLLVSFVSLGFLLRSYKIKILGVILFLGLLLSFNIYTQIISKPRNINRQQSATSRLNTWQQGLKLFEKSPFLGIGFNSYRYAIREYNLADQTFISQRGASANDSSLLFVLATTGILGLLIYLSFLFSIFKLGWQNLLEKNISGAILISGLIGILAHSIFNNSLFYPPILAWLSLVIILNLSNSSK